MALKNWFSFILLGCLLSFPLSAAFAQGRDSDGTRMQARHVEVGSTHRDSLSPPHDRADWRMIRLDQSSNLEIILTVHSGGEASLTLTDSSGHRIAGASAKPEKEAALNRRLDAGIYYISVESSESLRYTLQLK